VKILNRAERSPCPDRPTAVICVANQKGGVGKTRPRSHRGRAALHGNRVLVIDLDPQGNASTGPECAHHAGVPDVYDSLIPTSTPLADVTRR